jgi:hypothetical protein
MHTLSFKVLLSIFLIGWALGLSILLRSQTTFLSSSVVNISESVPETIPETIEPPMTTEEYFSCDDYSISGPSSVAFTEASWPATYRVSLNRPTDSSIMISSVLVEAKPKNTPAINYKHPADGSWSWIPWMTWKTQSIDNNGQSAILKTDDYAWYGVSGGQGLPDSLPPELRGIKHLYFEYPKLWLYSNEQSVYDINIVATLSNGCESEHSFEMQVKFVDRKNLGSFSRPELIIKEKKKITITSVKPFRYLLSDKRIYTACLSADGVDVLIKSSETILNPGQYRPAVIDEESWHSKQSRWDIGWKQGGLAWISAVLKEIFSDTRYCATWSSQELAQENVKIEFLNVYLSVYEYFTKNFWFSLATFLTEPTLDFNNLDKDTQQAVLMGCWREKTAKQFARLTPEWLGWFILEHAYPGCKQGMGEPKGPVELLKEELDYFRWYVQPTP